MTDVGKRAAHTTAWHTVHSPFHVGRVLMYAPRGLGRVVKAVWGWVFDAEGKPLRQGAVNANEANEWLKLAKERKERIHRRWIGLLVMAVLAVVGGLLLWFLTPRWHIALGWELTPGWLFTILAVTGTAALGYASRPRDGKPLIPPATSPTGETPLTNDVVLEALCSLGSQKLTKPEEIELLYRVKPARAGYNIDLTLPRGVTATAVMAKREELSSELQRGIGTVWPSVGPRHAGHLMLFISHEDMSTARQKPWPLLKQGTVDIFNAVPMFTDQRGDWVDLRLATTSGVVDAIPRMGKIYFLRLHPATVTDRFHDLVTAADLPPILLHDLQHGAASLMLAAGVDLKTVQETLGHSSITITSDTYTSVYPAVAAAASAALVPRAVGTDVITSRC